ncbi:Fe-S cluster assembly protein SufD [Catenulispora subtropica]|uniref:Fe-S cluster assembly protein SufD n=1 Tax=Catenulispora subtropica TaxID=450798 RepID=A0ABN2RRK8_9ACTN
MTTEGHGDLLPLSKIHRFTSRDVEAFEMPTGREEEWRYTPLAPLRGLLDGSALATDNGLYGREASDSPVEVRVAPSGDAAFGRVVAPADRIAAQAWRRFGHGLSVSIPEDAVLEAPASFVVTGQGVGRTAFGHVAIHAGRNSRATIIVHYRGSGTYAENVEVILDEGADLNVVFLNQWEDDAVHVSAHHTGLGRFSRLRHTVVTLGGSLVRISPTLTFSEPGASADHNGLCFANDGQFFEHRPVADHVGPRCSSNINYKCAAHGDDARSVWIGNALIRAGAEGTDSYQANRNILLSPGARADAVPNMEIEIGDIQRAGHESATGRFDDEQLFYLMARGITEHEARRLVLRGFFNEVIRRIGVESVEESVRDAIESELEHVGRSPSRVAAGVLDRV